MKAKRGFLPEPASVPAARRFVVDKLGRLPAEMVDTVRLLVSELVTNAVMYAGTDFTVELDQSTSSLVVSVTDSGTGTPEVRDLPDPADLHGRGLRIVLGLADDWGVIPGDAGIGKVVWFELNLSQRERSPA